MMSESDHEAREGSGCAGCHWCYLVGGGEHRSPRCPACFGTGCAVHGSLIEPAKGNLMPEDLCEIVPLTITYTGAAHVKPHLGYNAYPPAAWEIRRYVSGMREAVDALDLLAALRVFHSRHRLPRSAAFLLDELEAHRAYEKTLEQQIRDTLAGKGAHHA